MRTKSRKSKVESQPEIHPETFHLQINSVSLFLNPNGIVSSSPGLRGTSYPG